MHSKSFIQNYFYQLYSNEFDLVPFYDEENDKGDNPVSFGDFAKKENKFMQEIQNKIVAANLTKAQNYLLSTIILIFEIHGDLLF